MTSEAPELLPCPFCGGEAEWKSGGRGCAFITCTSCPAETGDGSIPRIKAAWNTRADLHQQALEAAEARGYARAVEIANGLVGYDAREAGAIDAGEGFDLACTMFAEAVSALSPTPADPVAEADSFDALIGDAKSEAQRAMQKFPQPNYVISKVAEEAGEVVKAAIHCAEGRESASEVRAEMKQLIAMLYRLWVEGDGVHGLRALAEQEGE